MLKILDFEKDHTEMDKKFKSYLTKIFENKMGPLKNIKYGYIELDTKFAKDRIEYPGYDKNAQSAGGNDTSILPGFRSCVKTILFINEHNREGFRWKGPYRWIGNCYRENGKIDKEEVYDKGLDSYEGHIFLLVAKNVLSENYAVKKDKDKLSELIDYAQWTIEQFDNYGYHCISSEVIPEINGCVPEQIYPHSEKYLNSILEKIEKFGQDWYYTKI